MACTKCGKCLLDIDSDVTPATPIDAGGDGNGSSDPLTRTAPTAGVTPVDDAEVGYGDY